MSEKKQQVLKSLKLNKLSENHLEKREMKVLKGGCGCQNHDPNLSASYGGNLNLYDSPLFYYTKIIQYGKHHNILF